MEDVTEHDGSAGRNSSCLAEGASSLVHLFPSRAQEEEETDNCCFLNNQPVKKGYGLVVENGVVIENNKTAGIYCGLPYLSGRRCTFQGCESTDDIDRINIESLQSMDI